MGGLPLPFYNTQLHCLGISFHEHRIFTESFAFPLQIEAEPSRADEYWTFFAILSYSKRCAKAFAVGLHGRVHLQHRTAYLMGDTEVGRGTIEERGHFGSLPVPNTAESMSNQSNT